MSDSQRRGQIRGISIQRIVPLVVLLLGLVLFFALDLHRFLTCESLAQHNSQLQNFGQQVWAPPVFILIYAIAVAFSLPGGVVMTLAGGYMFGQWFGTIYVVIAATCGASALFFIAKTAIGDALQAKAGPAIKKMEAGFQDNALSYLLVLRLIPLFPFWLVNLVPAFLGVPLRTYVIGTFLGIIPGTFVFASLGAGFQSVLSQGETCSLSGALTPEVVTALVGLALLALLPVVYKRVKARRDARR